MDSPVFLQYLSLSEDSLDAPAALPPGIIAPPPEFDDLPEVSGEVPLGIVVFSLDVLASLLEEIQEVLPLLPIDLAPELPAFEDFDLEDFDLEDFDLEGSDSEDLPEIPSPEIPTETPTCLPPGLVCSPAVSNDSLAVSELSESDVNVTGIGGAVSFVGDDFIGNDELLNAADVDISNDGGLSTDDLAAERDYGTFGKFLVAYNFAGNLIFERVSGIAEASDTDSESGENDVFSGSGLNLFQRVSAIFGESPTEF